MCIRDSFRGGLNEGVPLWQVIKHDPKDIWELIDDCGLELNNEAYEALQERDPR